MSFKQILLENKLFFKIFFIFLLIMCGLGFILGVWFSVCAIFMAFFSLAVQISNMKTFSKKLSKNKMTFIPSPYANRSKIFIKDCEDKSKRRYFFSIYKVFVYLVMILWFAILASAKLIDIAGVLIGGSACALSSMVYGVLECVDSVKNNGLSGGKKV